LRCIKPLERQTPKIHSMIKLGPSMSSILPAPTGTAPVRQIELRVAELAELFNSLDPTPFHHRDLDRDAEEFLESWALEHPPGSEYRIVVHIERMPSADPSALVAEAVRNYFDYKSVLTGRALRTLLAEGRTCLAIGVGFLAACLAGAEAIKLVPRLPFGDLMSEGLLIGGWVAMWRPLQIFLYEWWPIARKRRIYQALARSSVQVVAVPA